MKVLGEVATSPQFKPWELASLAEAVRKDLIYRDGSVLAIENAHKAAFRTGLGNSLFVPTHRLGQITSEEVNRLSKNLIFFGTMNVLC